MFGDEWWEKKVNDETHRVHPVSIAKVRGLVRCAGWRADRGGEGVRLFGSAGPLGVDLGAGS